MPSVIKPQDRLRRVFETRPLNLDDVEVLAERILARAREEAAAVLRRASEQAESARLRAMEEGRRQGYIEGYEEGARAGRDEERRVAAEEFGHERASLTDALEGALRGFEEQRTRLLSDARDDVIRLALGIARRVTGRVVSSNSAPAIDNLRAILDRIGRRHVVQIAVHPDDAASIRQFAPELSKTLERLEHMVIVEDPEMGRGGCRVHLPDGQLDASIETQLDRVAEALLPGEAAT